MKIILASKNIAKTEAVKRFLDKYLNSEYTLETYETESGVSTTPTSATEGILGAKNRISQIRNMIPDADLFIGLEGIVEKNDYGTFVYGWAVIETREGRAGIGASGQVQIPEFIASNIQSFKELSELVKSSYPSEIVENLANIGTNGIITNNLYTRVDEFQDALRIAYGYLVNDMNYTAD